VLQFTSAMFGSLAWPVVVVIVAVLMRPELSGLLRRVASVEIPGAKMTFDGLADFRNIEKISEAAVKNVRPEDERAIVRLEETEFSPLKKMASSAPRDAIIDAWNLLEYQLDVAADRIAPGKPHGWPQVAPTLQAWDQWAELSPVVAELSRLRDYTARSAQPPLSSDAARYVAVVEDLVTTLRASVKRGFGNRSGGGG
jgi:hypothetical protein